MKIVSWNMNYWQNTKGKLSNAIIWKNKCIDFLKNEKDVDFYILQEINPIKLFEKTPSQYEFSMREYNIIYHELTNELLYDGIRSNFWGNAILYNKKYKIENERLSYSDKYKNYYGRNGIMYYKFRFNENTNLVIINFYNKINYANKAEYIRQLFESDKEINSILSESSNIILAGDFNTGFNRTDKDKYMKFIEIYKKYNLNDNIKNFSKDFFPTSFYLRNKCFYLNDFCFTKNMFNIELLNKKDEWESNGKNRLWKGLSDHRPLIFNMDINSKPNFA